jgi:hypothetical protein
MSSGANIDDTLLCSRIREKHDCNVRPAMRALLFALQRAKRIAVIPHSLGFARACFFAVYNDDAA